MKPTPARPLPFDPAAERQRPGEATAGAAINQGMRRILETTFATYGHPVRSVHAKSHGLLEGELRVLDGLPPELAQGLFARAATYPAVLRISTNPGDVLDDTVSAPRGIALKVIGVEGERLPGSEEHVTQDFVMANGPAFAARDPAAFAANLGLLAATTDTGQGWKKLFSAGLRGASAALKGVGIELPPLKTLGGQPMTHPLGDTFHTQTAYRYGDHVAKLSLAPVSPALTRLKDRPVPLAGRPNGLRQSVIDHFLREGGEWELRVQLRTHAASMPIEDASAVWPEAESPHVAVARLTVPPQPAWSEARARQVDDAYSFSPWHGLAAHRPLGAINRVRRDSYALSARFRAARGGCPIHHPEGAPALAADRAAVYGTRRGREGARPGTPDARPGVIGQPMKPAAARIAGGAVGGLAAGTLLTGVLLALGARDGGPDEVVRLKRRAGLELGRGRWFEGARPTLGEAAAAHGGHLALSVAAGAAYGALKPKKMGAVPAGLAFGAGFFALAYGVVGPATGVTPLPWRDRGRDVAQRGLLHLLFGVATALVAERAARRL